MRERKQERFLADKKTFLLLDERDGRGYLRGEVGLWSRAGRGGDQLCVLSSASRSSMKVTT